MILIIQSIDELTEAVFITIQITRFEIQTIIASIFQNSSFTSMFKPDLSTKGEDKEEMEKSKNNKGDVFSKFF